MGFPHISVGKESACNAGDPGSIPGLGGFPGEGHGNPPQYSCPSPGNPPNPGIEPGSPALQADSLPTEI